MDKPLETADWAPPLPANLLQQRALQLRLDSTAPGLDGLDVARPAVLGQWIKAQVAQAQCQWAIGGYGEDRVIYAMSPLFGGDADARSVHLGVDFWLPAGTPVFAAHAGQVHSLGNNSAFGDYGGTVLLAHPGIGLFSLYGHLAPGSINQLQAGQPIAKGERLGVLGEPHENVGWPPHLHFQLMTGLGDHVGDFPGVCARDEAQSWLHRCPDPAPLLQGWCPEVVTA